jgi:hypothetical protein
LKGKYWEDIGNQGKMKKNPSPSNLKGKKKTRHLECMLGPSHWLHEISCCKRRVGHHFWHGLIPLAKNTLVIDIDIVNFPPSCWVLLFATWIACLILAIIWCSQKKLKKKGVTHRERLIISC